MLPAIGGRCAVFSEGKSRRCWGRDWLSFSNFMFHLLCCWRGDRKQNKRGLRLSELILIKSFTWLCWEGILEDRQEGEGSLRRAPSNRPLNPVSPILPILPFPVLLIHHELIHNELLHSEFYALHISSEFWTKFNCHLFILFWIRFVHLFFLHFLDNLNGLDFLTFNRWNQCILTLLK